MSPLFRVIAPVSLNFFLFMKSRLLLAAFSLSLGLVLRAQEVKSPDGPALPIAASATPASEPAPIRAGIEASQTGASISPYSYGQFVEHIHDLVNDTLWAEMLDDRKFYH